MKKATLGFTLTLNWLLLFFLRFQYHRMTPKRGSCIYIGCPPENHLMAGLSLFTAVSRKVALQTRRTLRDNAESYYG